MCDKEQMLERQRREQQLRTKAMVEQKPLTYIDTDGCEVTITASGHVFYNAADWY